MRFDMFQNTELAGRIFFFFLFQWVNPLAFAQSAEPVSMKIKVRNTSPPVGPKPQVAPY